MFSRFVPSGFALLLASLALATGLAMGSTASAASYIDMRIIGGVPAIDTYAEPHSDPCGTDYWHCDEAGLPTQVALDLHPSDHDYNRTAWFESWSNSGSGYAYGVVSYSAPGFCPGVKIHIWVPYPNSSTGTWVGWENYVQINPTIVNGTSFYTASYGWTLLTLGPIATTKPCASWSGAHLHQSGGTGPNIYTNWSLNDDNGSAWGLGINPSGDTNYNFLHQIYY